MSTNSYGAPWVIKRDNKEFQFPLLKLRQLAVLQAVIQAERSEIAKRLAAEYKLKVEETVRARLMAEMSGMDIGVVRVWAQSPVGIIRTLEESLSGNPKAPEIIDDLSFSEGEEASLRVTGWVPGERKPTLAEAIQGAGWTATLPTADLSGVTDALKSLGWRPPVEVLDKPNPTSADAK